MLLNDLQLWHLIIIKMKNKVVINSLDFLNLVFGLSVLSHKRGKWCNIWNRGRGLFFLFTSTILAIDGVKSLGGSSVILYELSNVIYYIGQTVFVICIHFFGKRISLFFEDTTTYLTRNQCRKLQRLSIVLTVLLIVEFACIQAAYLVADFSFDLPIIGTIPYNLISVNDCDYNYHGLVLYFVAISACYFACKNLLKRILKLAAKDSGPVAISRQIHVIQELVQEINLLAGIPFLMVLFYILTALPGGMSALFDNGSHVKEGTSLTVAVTELLTTSLYGVFVTGLAIYVSRLRTKLEQQRQKILDYIMLSKSSTFDSDKTSIRWTICLKELQDPSLFEFSIMSLFTLDFKLILSFSGEIISLSVLFISIEKTVKGEDSL